MQFQATMVRKWRQKNVAKERISEDFVFLKSAKKGITLIFSL